MNSKTNVFMGYFWQKYVFAVLCWVMFPSCIIAQPDTTRPKWEQLPLYSDGELAAMPQYTSLGAAYRDWDKVVRLTLKGSTGYYGKVSDLPVDIDTLKNLQQLTVINESLSTLPPRLGRLANLQHLYLSNNKLSELPDTVCSLYNLRRIDLRANQLEELPDKIRRLSKLEALYLHDNPRLRKIPWEALRRLPRLRTLNLRNTAIPREELLLWQKKLPSVKMEF